MLEITVLNTVVVGILLLVTYYTSVCLYVKKLVLLEFRKLLFYITVFSLFGITGEVMVNTIYEYLLGAPLWEYRLFPAHNGNISYFFVLIWGSLGVYKYINDQALHRFRPNQRIKAGLIMGAEAIALEIIFNGLFIIVFGSYIFYYFPANLGPLSHLSCIQVIPFYFVVGFFLNSIVRQQDKIGYGRSVYGSILFYWMVIITFVFF